MINIHTRANSRSSGCEPRARITNSARTCGPGHCFCSRKMFERQLRPELFNTVDMIEFIAEFIVQTGKQVFAIYDKHQHNSRPIFM